MQAEKLSAQTNCRSSVLDRKTTLVVGAKQRGPMLYYAVLFLGMAEAHRFVYS